MRRTLRLRVLNSITAKVTIQVPDAAPVNIKLLLLVAKTRCNAKIKYPARSHKGIFWHSISGRADEPPADEDF